MAVNTRALRTAAPLRRGRRGRMIAGVCVGDCALDEHGEAIVAAAKEALVNAAKFAGEEQIAVYAEVSDDRIEAFVRDRGPGFDLAAVPSDRRGVRESILGRMERSGGHAIVRTNGN